MTRLRIGHSFFTHKFLMCSGEERVAPYCSECACDITISHILTNCINFDYERRAHSLSDKSLREILYNEDPGKVFSFLKDIELCNRI